MRRVALVLATLGCGSGSHSPDARDASEGTDADASSSRCDVTKPFGAPSLVEGVNTDEDDRWGWLTADERTMYFARALAGGEGFDLFTATRATASGAFGNVTMLATSTALSEKRPVVSGDGLTLYMEYTTAAGDADLRVATRATLTDEFSAHSSVSVDSPSSNELNPWITSDGLTLYFTSDRDGFNDIFVATRPPTSASFSTPVAVAELNSTAGDYMGALSGDGLELFFGSSRDTNLANDDIFRATRATPSGPFGAPVKVTELSDAATNEYPTWLSADRCQLLLTSNRPGGPASYNIWLATRPL
ncbi:MAG TPA: hypothetical protein VMZ53_12585 [Kofleriaceae bacterium]|nr:hypothetical protein [Kofleriaceae bacterium]